MITYTETGLTIHLPTRTPAATHERLLKALIAALTNVEEPDERNTIAHLLNQLTPTEINLEKGYQ
jgi:hypothetical protein